AGVQRGVRALVAGVGDRLAVQEVPGGLGHGLRRRRIGVRGVGAVGHRGDVEHDVADLAAGAVVHGDGVIGREVLDVGGGQRTPHAVDVAFLDVQLHVVLVGVVGHRHLLRGGGAEDALVAVESLVGDQIVDLPAGDLIRTGD